MIACNRVPYFLPVLCVVFPCVCWSIGEGKWCKGLWLVGLCLYILLLLWEGGDIDRRWGGINNILTN